MTRLPPGPSGRLLNSYRSLSDCFHYYPRWRDRYGDPFTVRAVTGTIVLAAQPHLIQQIFSADPELFAPFGADAVAPLVGPESLLLLQGERHKLERKLVMPPFHGSRMRAYGQQMRDATLQHVRGAADPVSFQSVAQHISLDVILRAVFGVAERDRLEGFLHSIREVVDSVHPAFLFMPFLQLELGGLGPFARFRHRYRELDALLKEEIRRARQRHGEDILSLLVQARYEDGSAMQDDAICDELRTLVVAGHETTALSLSWALDLLQRHPTAQRLLLAELDALGSHPTPDQLANLPYLDAACKETLRLYPVVTEVLRVLRAPFELGGYTLPAGTVVAPNIVLAHRDPERFPEPERFRPERFLEQRFTPFEYLPFGGGHRRCIGAAFATYEMKIVLGTLLSHFDVELVNPSAPKPVRRNITMAPHDGVPVRLRTRRRAAARSAAEPATAP